jgi:hypothetical protein
MPREDRRIIFDNDEAYKALYALCFQKQIKPPPPGRIAKIREISGDQVLVLVMNPQDGSASELEYGRDFLAAALMLFCRGAGIPLPKSAKKSVVITEGQVMLRVQI